MSEDKELRDWQAQIRVAMIKAADLYGTQVDNDAHEETMRILAEDDELTALRAENARLREELATTRARLERVAMASVGIIEDHQRLRAALRGDDAPEGQT